MESQSLIQERTLNHIELIDKIDYDESYFHHKLDNFFKKSDKNFEGDDDYNKRMNQRLLACLNKTYGSHNETQWNIYIITIIQEKIRKLDRLHWNKLVILSLSFPI